ncbi:MAG: maltotransferase domain-containing protein, partial [Planctomycetia bacterium]
MSERTVPEKTSELPNHLRRRVAIDRVGPEVDGGRFAVKRVRGDVVTVEADIICDGHEELDCRLHVRHGDTGQWTVIPMECQGNDRWTASVIADRIGLWHSIGITVHCPVSPCRTWSRQSSSSWPSQMMSAS